MANAHFMSFGWKLKKKKEQKTKFRKKKRLGKVVGAM